MLIAFASIRGTEGNSTLKEAVRSIEPEKSASLQRALDPVLLTAQGVSLGVKSAQRHTDFTDKDSTTCMHLFRSKYSWAASLLLLSSCPPV